MAHEGNGGFKMGKDKCITGMFVCAVICLLVSFLFLSFSCIRNPVMPKKQSNMELGKEVPAPHGYTEWKNR